MQFKFQRLKAALGTDEQGGGPNHPQGNRPTAANYPCPQQKAEIAPRRTAISSIRRLLLLPAEGDLPQGGPGDQVPGREGHRPDPGQHRLPVVLPGLKDSTPLQAGPFIELERFMIFFYKRIIWPNDNANA